MQQRKGAARAAAARAAAAAAAAAAAGVIVVCFKMLTCVYAAPSCSDATGDRKSSKRKLKKGALLQSRANTRGSDGWMCQQIPAT
jgi:hypothetical protein